MLPAADLTYQEFVDYFHSIGLDVQDAAALMVYIIIVGRTRMDWQTQNLDPKPNPSSLWIAEHLTTPGPARFWF